MINKREYARNVYRNKVILLDFLLIANLPCKIAFPAKNLESPLVAQHAWMDSIQTHYALS